MIKVISAKYIRGGSDREMLLDDDDFRSASDKIYSDAIVARRAVERLVHPGMIGKAKIVIWAFDVDESKNLLI